MMPSGLPFDDFRQLLAKLPELSGPAPVGEDRIAQMRALMARCAGRPVPRIARAQLALFVGTHSGLDELAAASPFAIKRRIEKLAAGDEPLNKLCLSVDLGLKVYDLALDLPVADITREAALEERDCAATMAFGMEAVGGTDLLCVAALDTDRGRSARLILDALAGGEGSERRDGSEEVPAPHRGRLGDPLETLRRLGGRETMAIAGAILAARVQKVPVLIDGSAAIAAAAVLHAVNPDALEHCLLADVSGQPQAQAARRIGLRPLTDIGLAVPDGCAAALGAGLVKAAVEAYA